MGRVIDCFAGGGGASTGIEAALGRPCDIAVNHDPKAIAMHRANHPNTHHVTEDIFSADLKSLVGDEPVDMMWASPDCTSHSKAKGGKPRERGLRILPWAVHKHAKDLKPNVIFMENVAEIQKWGPLGADGRPIKAREGEEYNRFVDAMGELGYAFECRELSACDFGAPTTRRRWYAVLRRDGAKIAWPEQTNGGGLFYDPYVPVSECIDFDDVGESIFDRKRPLAEATMRRIARGLRKFVLEDPSPFIVQIGYGERKGQRPRVNSIHEPLGTIVAQGVKHYLCTPFITKFYSTNTGHRADEPLHTITTSPGHFGLVSAFLVKYYGTGGCQGIGEPLGTITTRDRFGLVTVDIDGETYAVSDIKLRMLRPRELKLAQGFPEEYIIDRYDDGSPVPVTQQVRMIGNSVVPVMAERIVAANMEVLA
ncbi:DNA cytosine methyltransferase [Eggerthellaceae bacterium 24-137]